MSTLLQYGGTVVNIGALHIPIKGEDDTHVHTSSHASAVHNHALVESDIPENLAIKNLQVSDSQTNYNANLPGGLVCEALHVSEVLNVVDDAYIRVMPDNDQFDSQVLIGFDPNTMTDKDTGVFIHRGEDVITLNNDVGIRAPKHTIEGANFVSEFNVDTQNDLIAGNITKTPHLRTSHIKLYADGHSELKVDAPIWIRKGGLNVSNTNLNDMPKGSQISLIDGDIICRKIYALGDIDCNGKISETITGHDTGTHSHVKSMRADDGSIYIGLMRRSYDRATHKPVTHILKRQIPAYLAAEGFTLADIPAPYTVDNMTIHNWIVLAQDFKNDTSIEVDTVFPAATTGDWEDYIDPISIDLDAAEVEIDDHEARIAVLEGASSGGGELSNLTLLTASNNNDTITIPPNTVGLVLIAHDNLSGINVYLPAMNDRDVILVKNLNLADAGDEVILLHAAAGSGAKFDGRWTTIQLNASSVANNNTETYANQCARLQYITIYPTTAWEQDIYCRLNDSY